MKKIKKEKKIEAIESVIREIETVNVPAEKPKIPLITLDFAREDLNMLRDRLNELINRANA